MQARTRMAQQPSHGWQRRLLTGLSWIVAASFVVGAATKFYWGATFFGPPYSEKFVDWGYPSWFRFVVGGGELVGAVLLVTPRRRFLGAAILLTILVGAVATHVVNQNPIDQSIAAPTMLALVGIIAWASRPVDHRRGRRNRGGVTGTIRSTP